MVRCYIDCVKEDPKCNLALLTLRGIVSDFKHLPSIKRIAFLLKTAIHESILADDM